MELKSGWQVKGVYVDAKCDTEILVNPKHSDANGLKTSCFGEGVAPPLTRTERSTSLLLT
jgi:hypothetical protein